MTSLDHTAIHEEAAAVPAPPAAGSALTGATPVERVLALQRTAGNSAVTALIGRAAGPPDAVTPADGHAEREAERMAAGAGARPPAATPGRDGAIAGWGAEGGRLDAETATVLARERSGGRPLDGRLQRTFEGGFGTDLSGVHVHDDPAAHALSDRVNAHAFTTGSDIFFAPGQYAPATGAGHDLLAHELAHVVQQRAAGTTAIQRNYAGLPTMGQARADQSIDTKYHEKALEFELGTARRIEANATVNALASTLIGRVKRIVDAWAAHTGTNVNTTYEREFGWAGGDAYYGAFKMSAANINDVLTNAAAKPLRTKLKLIYNAVRNNNLAKWLKLAGIELDRQAKGKAPRNWEIRTQSESVERPAVGPHRLRTETHDETVTTGFAHDSGLDAMLSPGQVGSIADATNRERRPVNTGFFGMTTRDVFERDKFGKVLGWKDETSKANQERSASVTNRLGVNQQRTLTVGDLPDLTDAETDLALERQRVVPSDPTRANFRSTGAHRIPWTQGGEGLDVKLGSDSARVAAEIQGRLEAGISGSTDLMLHASEYLGVAPGSAEAKALRLGLAGWMIANRDHSFYEIYKAAVPYGLAFTVDPLHPGAEYEVPDHLVPMQRADFVGVLPNDGPLNSPFPKDYRSQAYKDHLAAALPNPGQTQNQAHTGLRAGGLSDPALSTMDKRDTAALQKLEEVVAAQTINAGDSKDLKMYAVRQIKLHPSFIHLGNVYGQERAETFLNTMLRNHHGAAAVSLDDPRTLLADLGIPRSIAELAKDADITRIGQIRQAIVNAPAPAPGPAMNAIDLVVGTLTLPEHERGMIKWSLIKKLRPAWPIDAGEDLLAQTLDRRTQIEQIAAMERTSGFWYSWGGMGMITGYQNASSLRAATAGVTSAQGPGLYVARDMTKSSSYGTDPGQGLLVVKLTDVPTINALNPAQIAKLNALQPRGVSADPFEAAYVYDRNISMEIMLRFGAGDYGRLTRNQGVQLSVDLKLAPVSDLITAYHGGHLVGGSKKNLKDQATSCGINTNAW